MAEAVKQFKDLTVTYEATGAVTLKVNTDMPGGAMAERRSLSLAATSGSRKTATFPLDNPSILEGKLIQFKASVGSGFTAILYEASIRVRPVGTYLDGTQGDVWETQPLSLGG